ncbi:IQ motif and ankyrin repeat domain-containing protein 1-like isoform X1 [Gadus macrocephalus]|uniref:IQ motif and ankyrin repeat domain-containing protein 1-like isoform X1 n=1 Tax=Gadus macrocephalus TaxID=80720 RepID=UPI0028CB7ED5|nr:IQ motif and ankyrin repeat domain-containing protein 1-like isoform X1 [Gadus macrocephalus]
MSTRNAKPYPTTEPKAQKGAKKAEAVPSTREDLAALALQCAMRQLLARRVLAQKRREKQDHEELMDRLEKEAFVALVRREREAAERQRKEEEEERKRKREEQQRLKRLLEASFDGVLKEVLAVLKEVSERDTENAVGFDEAGRRQRRLSQLRAVNTTDAHGNSAVSEAAAGGQTHIITLLAAKGADVNARGAFGRTPLFRAAFGGHLEAVQTLLQLGGDPRLRAGDGCTPEQVAPEESVAGVLRGWDLSLTDSMLTTMEAETQRRAEEEQEHEGALTDGLKQGLELVQKEHERCQRELQRARTQLSKRISEHDACSGKGMEPVTLQTVHGAEGVLSDAREAARRASDQLSLAKLAVRERSGGGTGLRCAHHDAITACGRSVLRLGWSLRFYVTLDSVTENGGVLCRVRDLDDVLFKDVGGKIRHDGRWPLVVDPGGQAASFLRYRDTNYLDAVSPGGLQADRLRVSLLGAIRFGKPLVIDMKEAELFDSVLSQLDQVMPGLGKELFSKELLRKERYLSLVRSSDGPSYARTEFRSDRIENFALIIITKQRHPQEHLLKTFYPIEVES